MVCIGATIGKVGYSTKDLATNQQVNAVTPSGGISPKFVYFQMRSKSFQERVLYYSGQATLPIINKSKWSALKLYLPSDEAEQIKLAGLMEDVLSESESLMELYRSKLSDLDDLRQSLLQKAFAGELT